MRILAALVLAAAVAAQSNHPVGQRDVSWSNTTGVGSATLLTRVLYPATTAGVDAPVATSPSGWPTIVFLHGYGHQGRDYAQLGADFASSGFVVLLPDTGVFNYQTLADDARANVVAALAASSQPGNPLQGAIDGTRLGVAGHSMGAACLAIALANNPGFRCAYAFAPVLPLVSQQIALDLPMGVCVGTGDNITPWASNAYPFYMLSAPTTGVKFLHRFHLSSTHMSLVGFSGLTPDYLRARDIATGFFRHFLDVDVCGMDRCVGPAALADAAVVGFEQTIVQPRIWSAAPLQIGQTVRISVSAEEGNTAILASDVVTPGLPTAIGTLLLDPATAFTWAIGATVRDQRVDVDLVVPNNPVLIGMPIAMQPAAPSALSAMQFGSAAAFAVSQ